MANLMANSYAMREHGLKSAFISKLRRSHGNGSHEASKQVMRMEPVD
jgi:hypothetical protein